jgi:hypothetical protein
VLGTDGIPILSTFIRVAVDGRTLYMETFHSPGRWVRWDMLSLHTNARRLTAPSAVAIAGPLAHDIVRYLVTRSRAPTAGYSLTSSPAWSIADLMPQGGPPTYFDEADLKEYIEVIDRRVLAATSQALSMANIDSSEFSSRRMQIFNNATIVANNTLLGSALSIGRSAASASVR